MKNILLICCFILCGFCSQGQITSLTTVNFYGLRGKAMNDTLVRGDSVVMAVMTAKMRTDSIANKASLAVKADSISYMSKAQALVDGAQLTINIMDTCTNRFAKKSSLDTTYSSLLSKIHPAAQSLSSVLLNGNSTNSAAIWKNTDSEIVVIIDPSDDYNGGVLGLYSPNLPDNPAAVYNSESIQIIKGANGGRLYYPLSASFGPDTIATNSLVYSNSASLGSQINLKANRDTIENELAYLDDTKADADSVDIWIGGLYTTLGNYIKVAKYSSDSSLFQLQVRAYEQSRKNDSAAFKTDLATKQPVGSYLVSEVDGSVTNEIQTLSGAGNTVSLSGGGSYIIPAQSYSSLTGTPTIPTNTNQLTNGSGFITGISSSNVTTALGYTPYNNTNPSGYITGYTETDPIWTGVAGNYRTKTQNDALYYPLGSNPSAYLTGITGSQINTALGYTAYNGATNPNSYISSVPTQTFTSLTGKPTTLLGYGITDAYPLSGNPSSFITQSGARTAISLTTTGTSGAASYNNTTGVLNVPNYVGTTYTAGTGINIASNVISRSKRQETYSGTTDASGNYTVVFGSAYSVAPNIQPTLIGGTALSGINVTSISTTGFTVNVYTRTTVSSLPIIGTLTGLLVGAATNPLVGGTVHVLITEF